MSLLLSPVTNQKDFSISSLNVISNKKHHRNILKAKENTYKHRCVRALKEKLKKYKLRHNGNEDREVLDVSQKLTNFLNIKSPKSRIIQNNNCIIDENYPKNYLFKMGRKKQLIKSKESSDLNGPFTNQTDDKNTVTFTEDKEKQQTNAFKLLMDSRNKSIGSNSPGKERPIDKHEVQEIAEKKNLKARRSLALQKLAEDKGSLKKKEMEEYQEYCIKKKMENRAERLKNMVTSNKVNKTEKLTNKVLKTKPSKEIASDLLVNKEVPKQKTLTLISLFNDSVIQTDMSPTKKLSKADSEFLEKLSPSLKKKENMLCYFKKVDKVIPLSTDMDNDSCSSNEDVVIKVKLSSKLKKKAKKNKLSVSNVNRENLESKGVSVDCIEISSEVAVDNQQSESNKSKDRRKRKRNYYLDNILINSNSKYIESPAKECRPKRNIKKPIKYNDDVDLFSSDDDLHIFTPKKKRNGDHVTSAKITTKIEDKSKSTSDVDKSDIPLKSKSANKTNKILHAASTVSVQKKNVKLAPIFAVKPQLDPAAIEAKQKFLHSGVPDKLKKYISDQKNKTKDQHIFPITVHIQQHKNNKCVIPTKRLCDQLKDVSDSELNLPLEHSLFSRFFDTLLYNNETENSIISKCDKSTVLQLIKKTYPKFPTYRTYHLLKDKKSGEIKDCSYQDLDNCLEVIQDSTDCINESPDTLNWCDKYKATSSKHIIGNFESIRELRKWLVTWTENEVKSKNKVNFESDSSDFCHSDSDSKNSTKTTNNLLLITGPVGSGKTSSVYAVAAELAIKVIEVNASSKRTGKIMLQDLQEATQSHKVNRGKSSTENSQKSQEIFETNKKLLNKRGRPKKNIEKSSNKDILPASKNVNLSQTASSQECVRTGMSLILIDDADIVFEQDDGFCSAIVQLVQSSKRPVILISSTTSCLHLQRFSQIAKNIDMHPFQPRILGTWLDIMCLVDCGICVPGTGATILDFCNGDIRKAINSLQFYVSSQMQSECENENNTPYSDIVPIMDDENSGMSWTENFNTDGKKLSSVNSFDNRLCKYIIGKQLTLSPGLPLDLFNIWWSIPKLLISTSNFQHLKQQNIDILDSENIHKTVVKMEAVANALDSISIAEYFRPNSAIWNDITNNPWFSEESDSVSENEVLYGYNSNQELTEEITHKLVVGSIFEAQHVLKIKKNTDVQFPSMDSRRERDRVVTRHHSLSNSFNPSAVLDRRALALDYWPYCRTICRVEKSKTDNNLKRNNRFCHYLKSLNVMCKTDYFDKLADSLHPYGPKEEGPLEIE
ncbi:enhanced level of genomic instability 1 [Plodia interpunctella]|uniref:enhanced level of genomic instability 1 n=1 Tax=Plodia interpunctella TaxID=58824 RepID=UPI002368C9CC|nr:enhanced level of genomic instability 1 [Plodia interpunctella]